MKKAGALTLTRPTNSDDRCVVSLKKAGALTLTRPTDSDDRYVVCQYVGRVSEAHPPPQPRLIREIPVAAVDQRRQHRQE